VVEKFVQLKSTGGGLVTEAAISELLALVERLLHLYTVSDHIHCDIFPSTLQISHDFIARAQPVEDISERIAEWGKEQAQIKLGMIGTDDRVSVGVDIATYMSELDEAFRVDLGFPFNDLISLQIMLSSWAYDDPRPEHTFYSATGDEIANACEQRIEGFDLSATDKILDFLTLHSDKLLMLEGATEPTTDLPVWEHRKRSHRYGLRPLIKIGERYYWGPHSVERSSKIWASMTNTHKFPSDIDAPTVAKLLNRYHEKYRLALQTKITEIVRRLTSHVEIEVSPSSRGFSVEDIGDVDVFALTSDRRLLLNIESKVIDQAYTNKDIKRVSEKIFGRTTSKGKFEKGLRLCALSASTRAPERGRGGSARHVLPRRCAHPALFGRMRQCRFAHGEFIWLSRQCGRRSTNLEGDHPHSEAGGAFFARFDGLRTCEPALSARVLARSHR
jgi:hypothetical protein